MIVRLLFLLVSGYVALCLLVFLLQRRMLFFPSRESPEAAMAAASRQGLEPWRDETGALLGWLARHPARAPEGTLLVLHGNAGSALDRTYLRGAFQGPRIEPALDLVLLEYPGYGPRSGSPAETALVSAAVEALDRLERERRGPVFLLGESLGSAVAALAAARRPAQVRGLLLVTPLASVPAIARRHYAFLPTFLIRDTLRADRALAHLSIPVGFLVAGQDEVVFPDLGCGLYETYSGPKRLWIEAGAGHNAIDYSPDRRCWQAMLAFVRNGR